MAGVAAKCSILDSVLLIFYSDCKYLCKSVLFAAAVFN